MKFQFGLFPILWTAGCCTLAAGTYGNLPLSFEVQTLCLAFVVTT